jgi:hypothetical protein
VAEITNLRAGRVKRHAAFLVPTVLAALSLAGVATRPNLSMGTAVRDLSQAEERVQERAQHAERLQELGSSKGLELAEAVLAAMRSRLPAPLPDLELHGLLRLIAERCGVELASLQIGAAHDPGLEHLDDVAGLREVHVEGASTLSGLLGALRGFQSLGRPAAVLEFRVERSEEQDRYHWSVVLGLFESHPLSTFESSEEEATGEGVP